MTRGIPALLVATVVVAGACASDGTGTDSDEAVIVAPSASTRPAPPETGDGTATGLPTNPATPVPPSDGTAADGATAEPDAPTSVTPTTVDRPDVGDPVVSSELVIEVDQPIDLAVRPGDDALYLVGQGGTITRFDTVSGEATSVYDISGRVSTSNEQGLLGLAFSPDGELGYVNFTDADGTTTIAEYPVDAGGVLDQSDERIVLTVDQPFGNHNAGDLAFGADGMLYVPLGDGGSGGDPQRRASDPTSLLGSLLRIDPAPDGDQPYTIPPDNPFANGSFRDVQGAPEVWAWGLRNPWKIDFDPVTDELWIADVGQNAHEEVNVVEPTGEGPAGFGADFGWSAFEGTERFNADVPDPGNTVMPVLTYPHSTGGCSISGGAPYRGSAIAELEPAYVYSDYCLGTVWALDLAGRRNLVLAEGFSEVTAIRAGPDGELYVLERSGGVHRLT